MNKKDIDYSIKSLQFNIKNADISVEAYKKLIEKSNDEILFNINKKKKAEDLQKTYPDLKIYKNSYVSYLILNEKTELEFKPFLIDNKKQTSNKDKYIFSLKCRPFIEDNKNHATIYYPEYVEIAKSLKGDREINNKLYTYNFDDIVLQFKGANIERFKNKMISFVGSFLAEHNKFNRSKLSLDDYSNHKNEIEAILMLA